MLSRLRNALGDADAFLDITHQSIQLRDDAPLRVDLFDFKQHLEEAKQAANQDERIDHLEQAVIAYRGDLLPDCYDDWIAPVREWLRDDYLSALESLILLHEEQRQYESAIRSAQRLLRFDPLHEAGYRRLMRLHALNGDRAGALRVYHACVENLQRELDVMPGNRTQDAYRLLLHRNPEAETAPEVSHGSVPLVGRDREWHTLVEAWRDASAGRPGMLTITGDAGIGKTRLAEEIAAWAERQGATVAVARCYATESDLAYAPITQWLQVEALRERWSSIDDVWLAELARIVPHLLDGYVATKASDPLSARWQRQRLFESMAQALLADDRPTLLLLDDLQWCDAETLDWLHYLLRLDVRHCLLFVATVRLENVEDDHRYQPLRLALQRIDRLTEIYLGPLNAEESAVLAGNLSGHTLTTEQATDIFQATEGNPLFVVETMQVAGENIQPGLTVETADSYLPPKVAAVLQQRLRQLSPSAQQLIQLAAVLGRTFTFDTLAEICELDEDAVVDMLDEAWRRRIIREQGINAYDFSHEKLRVVAYAQISPVRQRYLHRRVAIVLSAQSTEQTDEVCTQIAHHFHEAGDAIQAANFYLQAVSVASRRYAIESLLSASTKALALFQEIDPQQVDEANQLSQVAILNERMWSWEMVGDMNAYLQDLESLRAIGLGLEDETILNRESRLRAAALIHLGRYREAESLALASAERHRTAGAAEDEGICLTVVGRARREIGEYNEAVEAFEQALALLHSVESHVYQVQAYSYLSTTYWLMADYVAALECGQMALDICETHDSHERKRFALGDMGAAAAMLGQEAQARQWLAESLALAQQVTDMTQEAFCRAHLGWIALRDGDAEEGERQMQAAYELSRDTDLINYAPWILRGLAEAANALGQPEHARTLAAEALSIAQSNGQAREQQAAQRLLQTI